MCNSPTKNLRVLTCTVVSSDPVSAHTHLHSVSAQTMSFWFSGKGIGKEQLDIKFVEVISNLWVVTIMCA